MIVDCAIVHDVRGMTWLTCPKLLVLPRCWREYSMRAGAVGHLGGTRDNFSHACSITAGSRSVTAATWIRMLHFALDPQIGTDAAVDRVLDLGGRVDIDPYAEGCRVGRSCTR